MAAERSPDDRRRPDPHPVGPLMADLLPVIQVPKGSVTPYVLTVGDPDRAAAVGELLDGAAPSAASASTSPGRAPGRAST